MKKTLVAVALALTCSTSLAQNYNDAVAAYRDGNLAQAVQGFFDLALKEDPDAQYVLATLFEKGDKIEQNIEQAIYWYEQSAIRGNPFAQASLAAHLISGKYVKTDHARALEFFLAAAEQGHPQSQFNAAFMLEEGMGVEPDRLGALKWYEQAASQGNEKAQFNLGRLLAVNVQHAEDLIHAYKWLSMASSSANEAIVSAAKEVRAEVSRLLTAPQLALAYEAARKLKDESLMVAAPAVATHATGLANPANSAKDEDGTDGLVQLGQPQQQEPENTQSPLDMPLSEVSVEQLGLSESDTNVEIDS